MIRRRHLPLLAAALPIAAQAQTAAPWPQRPVRIVVPFGAGGIIDVVARIIADRSRSISASPSSSRTSPAPAPPSAPAP